MSVYGERHFGCWRSCITEAVEVLFSQFSKHISEPEIRQLRASAEAMQIRRERTLPSGMPDLAEFRCNGVSAPPDVLYVSQVHQIYGLFKDGKPMNKMFASSHQAWKTTALHMGAAYHLWTSEEVETLMRTKYVEFWDMYQNCRYPVMRADISRVAILHAYGGLYADLDTKPNRDWYAQAYLAVGSIMGPPGGGWKNTDWRDETDEDALPRKEQWDMEVLVAEIGASFLLKWLEHMKAEIAQKPYKNPKSFWAIAKMRYIWNTTGPLSMKRFLQQPVNKGLLARTLFLKMNWFKDEPKLTRQDRLQFVVITCESNSYFTKEHEIILPVGTETVALPRPPIRLRTCAKSGVPLVRQPSQATSQDARDLNHQLEDLKQLHAKRSADHQMLEKLIDEQQDDLRLLSDLRVFLQDHASGAAPFDYLVSPSVHCVVESLPTQLREWILGPVDLRRRNPLADLKVFYARHHPLLCVRPSTECTNPQCCLPLEPPADRSRARSPSTRPSPFGLANQRKQRRRVAPSSPY